MLCQSLLYSEMEFPVLYRRFLLVICFIHISVYMSISISQFITPPPPLPLSPLVSIHLFSTSVSQFLPCRPVHLYHFSRFHIYALIYDIFPVSYTHHCIHVNPNRPVQHTTIPNPSRFSPLGVHTFVFYICVSTSALQTGSSVPFF